MQGIRTFTARTFASLHVRNFRLYFIGQAISLSGSWMQTVAQGWLVLQLTGSGTQLGIIVALQFVPLLIIGPWGGVLVDRMPKRTILFWTQAIFMVLSFSLGVLVYTDAIELWMLYIFALSLGLVRVLDNPARQTFVSELVQTNHMQNAISLNATEGNVARAIGPSIAGGLIAGVGIGFCFLINSASYIVVIITLLLMRESEMNRSVPSRKMKGQLKAGFAYVLATPVIKNTLIMMAVIGMFAYEFQVSLPLLAKATFHGDAASYAALLTAMGIGSGIGGVYAASRTSIAPKHLVTFAAMFGLSMIATSLMPTLSWAVVGMGFVGFFSINVISLGNSMVQIESVPEMRGRVMALWSVAMLGSTPIGGPIVGYVGEHMGARWSIALGGAATMCASLWALSAMSQSATYQKLRHFLRLKGDQARDNGGHDAVSNSKL